jgi:hypothetical protein
MTDFISNSNFYFLEKYKQYKNVFIKTTTEHEQFSHRIKYTIIFYSKLKPIDKSIVYDWTWFVINYDVKTVDTIQDDKMQRLYIKTMLIGV